MAKILSSIITCGFFLLLFCSFQKTAYAYADPGSSLLMFQSLSSIITGALFFFRKRIMSIFHKPTRSGQPQGKIAE